MPPSLLSAELRKLTDEEWQLRSEHSLTPENRSRDPFVLGVSRMVAAPEGQVFRGDYVTVKFWLIYAVIGLLAAGGGVGLWLVWRFSDKAPCDAR